MARLARRFDDKRLLRIVRRFLEAGMMSRGVCRQRWQGTPQGGPLSPLLANLLLDDLDKLLDRPRQTMGGHRFCRYADDANIYVRSLAAGERVMASVRRFLEKKLHLKVNEEKSAVAPVEARKFLGYRLRPNGSCGIAPESLRRFKARVRQITRRNRGISRAQRIAELGAYLPGWMTYFRRARCKDQLRRIDGWLRRKLRCVKLKQGKVPPAIASFLQACGIPADQARLVAGSSKGWWCLANSPQAKTAMSRDWFERQGLVSLADRYLALQTRENRRGT